VDPKSISEDGVFPFLIGTVRTFNPSTRSQAHTIEFPFLIGTVRTNEGFRGLYSGAKFPFLIGTVRTTSLSGIFSFTFEVSIPHRYGKN